VVTLQTPAQAADVRALMRKAHIVPLAATVKPGSALLRVIAGEPAKPPAPQPRPDAAAAGNHHRKPGNPAPRSRRTAPGPRPAKARTHARQTAKRRPRQVF